MILEKSELTARMLQARNDQAYMSKRQRIDNALDQNNRKKMDGFSNDDNDSHISFKRCNDQAYQLFDRILNLKVPALIQQGW